MTHDQCNITHFVFSLFYMFCCLCISCEGTCLYLYFLNSRFGENGSINVTRILQFFFFYLYCCRIIFSKCKEVVLLSVSYKKH